MKILLTTHEQFHEIYKLDMSFIGTENYLGFAMFWHFDYRHSLRDASQNQRRKVHNALLKHNLPVAGSSPKHEQIISKFIK